MRRALWLASMLFAAACMRDESAVSQDAPRQASETPAQNPQSGTSQDTALNPTVPINTDSPTSRVPVAAAANSGEAQLIEYEIRMPATLAANHPLHLVNAGKEKHGFAIEGTSIKTNALNPGDASSVELKLAPGTYTAYCPVPGHREKGMTRTVVVQ